MPGGHGFAEKLYELSDILLLEAQGRFTEGEDAPLGLPKTRVLKVKKRVKVKKEKEEATENTEENADS